MNAVVKFVNNITGFGQHCHVRYLSPAQLEIETLIKITVF